MACLILLSGCAGPLLNGEPQRRDINVTTASLPTVVRSDQRTDKVLACIKTNKFLSGVTFVVGPFADSTGKVNAVASGSTGNFLPQGGSSAYITDAIRKAGGTVVSTYFGQPRKAVASQYSINGIFNSLDFGSNYNLDMRVGGVGPISKNGWAQLSLTIQLDEIATNVNRQISMVQRPVRYSKIGAGISRTIGNNLVTGETYFENQERLQFEALNGPIALGVASVVLKEFPDAKHACGGLIADLVNT